MEDKNEAQEPETETEQQYCLNRINIWRKVYDEVMSEYYGDKPPFKIDWDKIELETMRAMGFDRVNVVSSEELDEIIKVFDSIIMEFLN
jgi:hypothetical protein